HSPLCLSCHHPTPTKIYTLSLHDALPIYNTAVTQRAIGLTRLPEDKNASEELRRYMNLCNTVQLSFFQNNALFEDRDAGWKRVGDRKSTRLNSSHLVISYAVFCLKKKK